MKHISKILLGACVLATATWVFISLVVIVEDKEPHKPDTFQCPHCGTKLKWSELGRGYIECRSGWTAATPNPVPPDGWVRNYAATNAGGWEVKDLRWRVKRLEDKIETMTKPISIEEYITTNRVWITMDPVDNMPMIGVGVNGELVRRKR